MSMVEINNLTRSYYTSRVVFVKALQGISLSIEQGELVAITGTSGSGKSTLLHILGGIDTNYEGEYRLDGQDIRQFSRRKLAQFRNQRVGIVLQNFGLIPEMSVYDNIALPLYLGDQHMKKKELYVRIQSLLQQVQLEEKLYTKAKLLSGGQKQRIAIARALMNDPQLILADEPTGALDQKTSSEIMNVFEGLHEAGHTVVIITHDLQIAMRCKRRICLEDGRVVEDIRTP